MMYEEKEMNIGELKDKVCQRAQEKGCGGLTCKQCDTVMNIINIAIDEKLKDLVKRIGGQNG